MDPLPIKKYLGFINPRAWFTWRLHMDLEIMDLFSGWWLTKPLWKIWVRQSGWWTSNCIWENKIHVPNHQPVLPSEGRSCIDNLLLFGVIMCHMQPPATTWTSARQTFEISRVLALFLLPSAAAFPWFQWMIYEYQGGSINWLVVYQPIWKL